MKPKLKKLHRNNVRLTVIGDLSVFPKRMRKLIDDAEALTRPNTSLNLQMAINYGGRWDIAQATSRIAQEVASGTLAADDVNEDAISSRLSTAGVPEPDLFIRTGGETRVSNFLLWQLAYTELYFTPTLWPDFDEQELDKAIESFAGRQRRFGQTGDQVVVQKTASDA